MNLVALSRANIEGNLTITQQGPAVAICIAYPKGRCHAVHQCGNLLAVLHLRFSDCDGGGVWRFPAHKSPENIPLPMTPAQAGETLDFVEAWKDQVETIYCACYGGVSRSTGMLRGLAKIYGWAPPDHGDPNPWCEELLLHAAMVRGIA